MARKRFDARPGWAKACLIGCCIVGAQVEASPIGAASTLPSPSIAVNSGALSGVSGESWLDHLHRSFGETSMGKTGRLGPIPSTPQDRQFRSSGESTSGLSNRVITLHGSDLYRLNCQGCHGEAGLGAPPEIASVIGPVRATSVALVIERMKKIGMAMSRAEAIQLAGQSKAALLKRLHTGGQDMPAFPQLSEGEIRSLVAYLKQLADVPGAAKEQLAVRESPLRVGELIVKSTCHTCHSAEGSNPNPEQLLQGAIPPLSTLTMRTDQRGLVRKVTSGALANMGTPALPYRGRMPVFFYLSDDEAADVYQYLMAYEVSAAATAGAAIPSPPPDRAAKAGPSTVLTASFLPPGTAATYDKSINLEIVGLAGLFAALLLAAGAVVTVHEFKRLSDESEVRRWEARSAHLQVRRRNLVTPIRARAASSLEIVGPEPARQEASGLRH